jgi:hypothetical protein
MDKKIRFTVLGLIFILSTLFFWSAINSALQPSKAQTAVNFKVFFLDKTMECNKNGLCLAYLYGSSNPGVKIAGVQGSISFSPVIEPIAMIQDSKCAADSFKLDRQLDFKKTTLSTGEEVVTFAMGSVKKDADLVEGNHCIGAVLLQPKNITAIPTAAKIALTDSTLWKAGGSTTVSVGTDTAPVMITINDTAPIPSVTPPPPGGGTPPAGGSCARKAEGDCSCDDKVDLIDWDILRSSLNGEGASCDVNTDGATNALDLSIWLQKNDLLKSGIEPVPTSAVPTTAVSPSPATPAKNSTLSPTPTGTAIVTPSATPTPGATDVSPTSSPTPTP